MKDATPVEMDTKGMKFVKSISWPISPRSNMAITVAKTTRRRSMDSKIERRNIHLAEPIKQLGEHRVPVRLHREVTIDIPVTVTREE